MAVLATFASRVTSLGGGVVSPFLENAIGIDKALVVYILSEKGKVVHEAFWNEYFDNDVPYDSCSSNYYADKVLMSVERYQLEGLATILDDEQLQEEDADDDGNEEIIIEEI